MSLLSGLKIYTVHVRAGSQHALEKPLFLREGFNYWAFALTGFWALYHRLWLPLLGIIICNILMVELGNQHIVSSFTLGVLQLAVNLLVGFMANDWRRAKLSRQGYLFADITTGDSLLRAERRYFERYLKTVAA